MANMTKTKIVCGMKPMSAVNAPSMVIVYSTSESWACASDRAQRRRYDALRVSANNLEPDGTYVLEIQPKQNSMV